MKRKIPVRIIAFIALVCMIASAVAVGRFCTKAVEKYTISVSVTNGTATVSPETIEAGGNVTVTATPKDESYILQSVLVDGVSISMEELEQFFYNNYYIFTAVNASHSIDITYNKMFTVSFAYTGTKPDTAPNPWEESTYYVGSTVTITDVTAEGYSFSGWSTTSSDVTLVNNQFEMPWHDVVFTGSFTELAGKTITYTAETGGTVSPYEEVVSASAASTAGSTATANPGYSFVAWKDASDNVVSTDATLVLQKPESGWANATYTAYFSESWKNVTYHANTSSIGDEEIADNDVSYMPENTKATYSQEAYVSTQKPTLLGYKLLGWSTTPTGTVEYRPGDLLKNADSLPEEDINLYAIWEEDINTVTYEYVTNDGANPIPTGAPDVPAAADYQAGKTVNVQTAPTLLGYTFSGWTTSDATVSESGEFTMPGNNVKITGYWIEKEHVVINYEAGDHGSVSLDSTSFNPEIGTPEGSKAEPSEGYKFLNWVDAAGTSVSELKSFTPTKPKTGWANATYTAVFEEITATLKYDDNVADAEITVPTDQNLKYTEAATIPTDVPERTGFDFLGWATTAGGEAEYQPGGEFKGENKVPENATLYAVWKAKEYKVTYVYSDNNGANPIPEGAPDLPAEQKYVAGAEVEVAEEAAMAGYVSSGWASDDLDLTEGEFEMPMSDVTITTYWTELDPVTITYKADGNGSVSKEETSFNPEIGQPAASTAKPQKGYKLKNWIDADGNAVSDKEEFKPKKPATGWENATYTAVFEEITATLTYDANGGQDGPEVETLKYTKATSTAEKEPVRNGYSFEGWAETAGGEVKFEAGDVIKIAGVIPEDITLYAVWTPVVYKITYELGGGTNSTDNPATYTAEDGFALKSPTRDGYTFKGWFNEKGEEVTEITKGTYGDLKFTASWKEKPFGPETGDKSRMLLLIMALVLAVIIINNSGICLLKLKDGSKK